MNSEYIKYYRINSDGIIQSIKHTDTYFFMKDNKSQITGQHIDQYGKTRIVELDGTFCIYIRPSQPFNVKNLNKYKSQSEEDVIKRFGIPDYVTSNGFWYSDEYEPYAFFILCKHKRPPSFQIEEESPIFETELKFNERTKLNKKKNIERIASVIIQLINWLWKIYSFENTTNIFLDEYYRIVDVKGFFDKYIGIASSSNLRDLRDKTTFPVLLPDVTNVIEGIQWGRTWWPALFKRDKIVLYEELYNKVVEFYQRENKAMMNSNMHISTLKNNELKGIYFLPENFEQVKGYIFFNSLNKFDVWYNTEVEEKGGGGGALAENAGGGEKIYQSQIAFDSNIYSKVEDLDFTINSFNPLICEVDGKFFILQNVQNNTFLSSIYVALQWKENRQNVGYTDKIIQGKFPHILYIIGKDKRIFPHRKENVKQGDLPKDVLRILSYDSKKFAALLPI